MKNPDFRKSNAGIGIIEVLVALVVVSMGVLGMASLQLTGMKHSSSGYNRSMAVLYAENLATRMRSNQQGVSDFAYDGFDSDNQNCAAKPDPFCQAQIGQASEACDINEMANFDLMSIACGSWGSDGEARDGVIDSLSAGRLQVGCDDSPCLENSNYTLTITWNEGRTTDNTEDTDLKRVQVRFNP